MSIKFNYESTLAIFCKHFNENIKISTSTTLTPEKLSQYIEANKAANVILNTDNARTREEFLNGFSHNSRAVILEVGMLLKQAQIQDDNFVDRVNKGIVLTELLSKNVIEVNAGGHGSFGEYEVGSVGFLHQSFKQVPDYLDKEKYTEYEKANHIILNTQVIQLQRMHTFDFDEFHTENLLSRDYVIGFNVTRLEYAFSEFIDELIGNLDDTWHEDEGGEFSFEYDVLNSMYKVEFREKVISYKTTHHSSKF